MWTQFIQPNVHMSSRTTLPRRWASRSGSELSQTLFWSSGAAPCGGYCASKTRCSAVRPSGVGAGVGAIRGALVGVAWSPGGGRGTAVGTLAEAGSAVGTPADLGCEGMDAEDAGAAVGMVAAVGRLAGCAQDARTAAADRTMRWGRRLVRMKAPRTGTVGPLRGAAQAVCRLPEGQAKAGTDLD